MRVMGLFVLAGLQEVGGGYLVWLWLRQQRSLMVGLGGMAMNLTYRVENNGLSAAPATTLSLTVEAGDPFSPISTAIALQNIATPALGSGATTAAAVLVIPEAVYIKVDLRADAFNIVNERTEHDNHRVHSVGYVP